MKKRKLLIVVNVDWFFISHRMVIAEKAIEAGWSVFVACNDTGRSKEIIQKGINYTNIPLSRSGTNLFDELKTIFSVYRLYKEVEPDVVHNVSLKPIVYGGLITRLFKIRGVVNAISGLGYNFTSDRKGLVQNIMMKLMKIGFKNSCTSVIFQNKDDYSLFKKQGILNEKNQVYFIKGSGVDLEEYKEMEFENNARTFILFPARMLRDKGIDELKNASLILKERFYDKVTFLLAGFIDEENKAGVSETYIREWEDGEYVKWIGYNKNMVQVYAKSDLVVLPSYREGMPKSLIEACAIGRPIVTTNAIGCKECVDDGINGFKVPIKDSIKLAKALEKLIESKELRKKMGEASRLKAEKEFSLEGVIHSHLRIYNNLYNFYNAKNS